MAMVQPEFSALVDAHYASLYRFAFSLARNSADACDLVQQTFFVWGTKGTTLRDASKAKTWLFTTLYREFIRLRRRDVRSRSIEELPPADREIADTDIERLRSLDQSAALSALGEVPELFRVPLTLYYLEDLSYHEIAGMLGIPIGTVMSRLSRAKQHLRAALGEDPQSRAKLLPFPDQRP